MCVVGSQGEGGGVGGDVAQAMTPGLACIRCDELCRCPHPVRLVLRETSTTRPKGAAAAAATTGARDPRQRRQRHPLYSAIIQDAQCAAHTGACNGGCVIVRCISNL